MTAARLRRVGGSTMLAIPPEILEALQVSAGAELDLSVDQGVLQGRLARPKYSLQQLLAEERQAGIDPLASQNPDWTDGEPVGREPW